MIVTFVDNLPVSVGNGTDASAPTAIITPHDVPGVTLVADLGYLGEAVYRGTSEDQDADDLCDLIMTYENVETCEPDSSSSIDQTVTPNDPLLSQQTYLNLTNTVALWQQKVFGNRNVKIGVIDTGVDLNNPDLAPSLWTNPSPSTDSVSGSLHCASFLNGNSSGSCLDQNGVRLCLHTVTRNTLSVVADPRVMCLCSMALSLQGKSQQLPTTWWTWPGLCNYRPSSPASTWTAPATVRYQML